MIRLISHEFTTIGDLINILYNMLRSVIIPNTCDTTVFNRGYTYDSANCQYNFDQKLIKLRRAVNVRVTYVVSYECLKQYSHLRVR